MILSRIKARMRPSTRDEWDCARASLIQSPATEQTAEQTVFDAVKTLHRLSLACFLEQIDPVELSLAPELLTKVCSELDCLQQFEPLSAYAAALDRISTDRGTSSCPSGSSDAQA
jgi:hypothetical protein